MHVSFDSATGPVSAINFEEFMKVDIRIGTVVEATDFPEAKNPSFKLVVDFGPGVGLKKTSAQLTHLYDPTKLLGKQVAGVVNLPPRQIGKFMSEVLVLGFANGSSEIVLFSTDHPVPNGSRLL